MREEMRASVNLFQAKINEEYQQQKTLEKPEAADGEARVNAFSSVSSLNADKLRGHDQEAIETVPPASAEAFPMIVGGEDKDPVARERRNKVKEVSRQRYFHLLIVTNEFSIRISLIFAFLLFFKTTKFRSVPRGTRFLFPFQ